jgi:hypothetical protein
LGVGDDGEGEERSGEEGETLAELNESFAELLVENGEKNGEREDETEEKKQEHEQEQEQEQRWKQEQGQAREEKTADGGLEEVVIEEDSVDEESWAQLMKEQLEFVVEQEAGVERREGEGVDVGQQLLHNDGVVAVTQGNDRGAQEEKRDKVVDADNNGLTGDGDDEEEVVESTFRTTDATLGGVVGYSEDSGEEKDKQVADEYYDQIASSVDSLDALAADLVATALRADDTNSSADPTDSREPAGPVHVANPFDLTDLIEPADPTESTDPKSPTLDGLAAVLVATALEVAIQEMQNRSSAGESSEMRTLDL